MRCSTSVFGLVIAVIAVAPAAAQQNLGDVADSIRLKRPGAESVVIDRKAIGQTRSAPGRITDPDFFRNVLRDCLTETQALYDLLVETRDGASFYRDEWRYRVSEVGLRLDGATGDLTMVAVAGPYFEAYETAERGANAASAALEILRGAIADNRPVFSQARVLSKEALGLFDRAHSQIGAASRSEAAESVPQVINPIEADRVMRSLCQGRHETGSAGFAECMEAQTAALDAMNRRSGADVGLDPAAFNKIRNDCRFEWPDNYVTQDRCEQQRSAATKSR